MGVGLLSSKAINRMEVNSGSTAVVDLGWFSDVGPSSYWPRIIDRFSFFGNRKIAKSCRIDVARTSFFDESWGIGPSDYLLLESFFEFDHIFVDGNATRAGQSLEIPAELAGIFQVRRPTNSVYADAISLLQKFLRIYRSEIAEYDKVFGDLPFPKTHYFDRLFSVFDIKDSYGILARLANSDMENDYHRALFYVAFAQSLNSTAFMSAQKAEFLEKSTLYAFRSQHERVYKIIDSSFRKEFAEICRESEVEWCGWVENVPPIMEHVVSVSISRDVSPIEYMMHLRDSRDAVEYRRLLCELRVAASGLGRKNYLEALRIKKDVKRMADDWAKILDVSVGVRWAPRRLLWRVLPVFGKVFEFFGYGESEIKSKIVGEGCGYLRFCSLWYDNTSR
ncbi:MAG: hypothetical protein H6843_17455 [Rhodospirillaceae bacterium]|nr:hypothetical protein [Rhodospirillaceae bacterium]